jgi:hypothetical protein
MGDYWAFQWLYSVQGATSFNKEHRLTADLLDVSLYRSIYFQYQVSYSVVGKRKDIKII